MRKQVCNKMRGLQVQFGPVAVPIRNRCAMLGAERYPANRMYSLWLTGNLISVGFSYFFGLRVVQGFRRFRV